VELNYSSDTPGGARFKAATLSRRISRRVDKERISSVSRCSVLMFAPLADDLGRRLLHLQPPSVNSPAPGISCAPKLVRLNYRGEWLAGCLNFRCAPGGASQDRISRIDFCRSSEATRSMATSPEDGTCLPSKKVYGEKTVISVGDDAS